MKINSIFSNQEPQVYGFALGNTGRILYRLKNINCCYLVFSNNIDHYLNMLLHDQPTYILGIESYSGVDQDKIRIGTICSNQFRNDFLDGNISRDKNSTISRADTPGKVRQWYWQFLLQYGQLENHAANQSAKTPLTIYVSPYSQNNEIVDCQSRD